MIAGLILNSILLFAASSKPEESNDLSVAACSEAEGSADLLIATQSEPGESEESSFSDNIFGPHNHFLEARSESIPEGSDNNYLTYRRFNKICERIHHVSAENEHSFERFLTNTKFLVLVALHQCSEPIFEFKLQQDSVENALAAKNLASEIIRIFESLYFQAFSFNILEERLDEMITPLVEIVSVLDAALNDKTILLAFRIHENIYKYHPKSSHLFPDIFLYKNLYKLIEKDLDNGLKSIRMKNADAIVFSSMFISYLIRDPLYFRSTPIELIERYVYIDQYDHHCYFKAIYLNDLVRKCKSEIDESSFVMFYDPIVIPLAVAFHYLLDGKDKELCQNINNRIAFTNRLELLIELFFENTKDILTQDIVDAIGSNVKTLPAVHDQELLDENYKLKSLSRIFEGLQEGFDTIYFACLHISQTLMQLSNVESSVFVKVLSRMSCYICLEKEPTDE